ncbi:MAG: hypothetical protein IIZ04_03430 [Aeriscardovia sp.]|nr:hypothetical protein [Aeriscardovia sp.]
MTYNPDNDRSRITPLPGGGYEAIDNEGNKKRFRTEFGAMQWLWNKNWGRLPGDKKYDHDIVKRHATYAQVRAKAHRLLEDSDVEVHKLSHYQCRALVAGDHDLYVTTVTNKARANKSNPVFKDTWFCTCEWGQWCNSGHRPHDGPDSTGSVKIQNRFCSHAYAVFMVLLNFRKYGIDITGEEFPNYGGRV